MKKNKTYLPLLYSIIFIVLFNSIGSFLIFRLDLTSEKRYTLSEETKSILTNIDDLIYIKVYLDGNIPSDYKHLQKKTQELLQEFKNIAGKKIDFEFINPSESSSKKERYATYKQLEQQGLTPKIEIEDMMAGMSGSFIFPWATIYYGNKKEIHKIYLLKESSRGRDRKDMINNSIESLEYEFISAIAQLTKNQKEKIAFLRGHAELNEKEVADISYSLRNDNYSLSEYYEVEHFDITKFEFDSISNQPNLAKQFQKLQEYKAIIIAKPKLAFRKLDKLLIDQYIMGGGNVLWLLDGVNANMDNLQEGFMAEKKELNLDDMLFIYGVRIKANLIQDLRSGKIEIVDYRESRPKGYFFEWPYYPLLNSDSKHPIAKNLDAIKCEFVSSVDTIQNNINKTILLHSSANARVIPSPHRISLRILKNPTSEKHYSEQDIPIAVLLEGNFQSVFKNRMPPKNKSFDFKESGDNAKMIVVSDGDVIRNSFSEKTGYLPLGYDYDKEGQFINEGNKTFIMNAVHYLCDNNQDLLLSLLKTKELKLRLLDDDKVQKYKLYIQLLNLLLPILITLTFWILFAYTKKKKYA